MFASITEDGTDVTKETLSDILEKPFRTFHRGDQVYFVAPREQDLQKHPVLLFTVFLASKAGCEIVIGTAEAEYDLPKANKALLASIRQITRILNQGTGSLSNSSSTPYKKLVGSVLRTPMLAWCQEKAVPSSWTYGTRTSLARLVAPVWPVTKGRINVRSVIDSLFSRLVPKLKVAEPEKLVIPREQILSEKIARKLSCQNSGIFTPLETRYFLSTIPDLDIETLKEMSLEDFAKEGQKAIKSHSDAVNKVNAVCETVFAIRSRMLFPTSRGAKAFKGRTLMEKLSLLTEADFRKGFAPRYLATSIDWTAKYSELYTAVQEYNFTNELAKAICVEFVSLINETQG